MKTLDMRKRTCPIPVIETKKALDIHDETICTVVDNKIAAENIKRMANDIGASVEVRESSNELFYVYTTLTGEIEMETVNLKNILVLNSEFMGQDPEIGANLMQACIHTLADIDTIPEYIILYNSAVKLFEGNQSIYNDLLHLSNLGVKIVSCGACIEHYSITKNIGEITNMYSILQLITKAEKVIYV